jgi:hypothetical protein
MNRAPAWYCFSLYRQGASNGRAAREAALG